MALDVTLPSLFVVPVQPGVASSTLQGGEDTVLVVAMALGPEIAGSKSSLLYNLLCSVLFWGCEQKGRRDFDPMPYRDDWCFVLYYPHHGCQLDQ